MIKKMEYDTSFYIKDNFQFNHAGLNGLFCEAIEKCILNKVSEPSGSIKRMWISPGGYYTGHWIWDTMFVVDLLSFVPGYEEIIRDAFRVYWDFQNNWNSQMPDFAHGMIANNVSPRKSSLFSQSGLIAWGMERIFMRTGDKIIVNEGIDRLEKYHDWFWRERDIDDIGLVGVGTYAPLVADSVYGESEEKLIQSARFETFDYQPALDDIKLVPHPRRGGPAMYGTVFLPDATAFLIQAEEALTRLACNVGRNDIAERRAYRIEKGIAAMRKYMWDEETGIFLAINREDMTRLTIPSISGFIPLFAGVPTQAQADRMAQELSRPDWNTFLPVPTVARFSRYFNDEKYGSDENISMMWRGDVWNQLNLVLCQGLARYGHSGIADRICDKTIGNVLIHGLNECYNPDSGKPLRVKHLGMSCAAVTMLLDGFGYEYRLTGTLHNSKSSEASRDMKSMDA